MATTTLPSVRSQAQLLSPSVTTKTNSTLDTLIQAAPNIVNNLVRASEVSNQRAQQEALNTQKAEDQRTLASAISDVNIMQADREAAQVAENSLQALSVDVNRAFSDGEISDSDRQIHQTFLDTFTKVKNARNQGLLDDNTFSIKAREAKDRFIGQYGHLAPEIDKIYNAATGRSASSTTGAAAQKQLQFNRRMESKYGLGYSAQDVLVEQAKITQAEGIKRNKEAGIVSFGQIVSDSNSAINLAVDDLSQQATSLYSGKQALDQNDLDVLNTKTEQMRRTVIRGIDAEVAQLRARGQIVDPAAVRAHKEYSIQQLDDVQSFYQDKDLQKMMQKRNDTEKAMWQAGMGGQITKLNSVAGLLGNGGLTALSGFITSATPAQEQVISSLAADSGLTPEALANTKTLVMDAAVRVSNPVTPPGFEKLDAFYGLGAMRAGDVAPVVQNNTLENLDKLVVNPQDVSGSITQLNDPKISLSYSTADTDTKNKLVQTTNGWESMVFNEIKQNGYTAEFDPTSQLFVVSRPEETLTGQSLATTLGIGAGPTAGDTVGNVTAINRGLTKTMNELYNIHKNPNYTGILQSPNEWLTQVTGLLQPQTSASAE